MNTAPTPLFLLSSAECSHCMENHTAGRIIHFHRFPLRQFIIRSFILFRSWQITFGLLRDSRRILRQLRFLCFLPHDFLYNGLYSSPVKHWRGCFHRLRIICEVRIVISNRIGDILRFAVGRLKLQQFNGSPLYGVANIEPQGKPSPFFLGRHGVHLPIFSRR